jgi:hypothetical protein
MDQFEDVNGKVDICVWGDNVISVFIKVLIKEQKGTEICLCDWFRKVAILPCHKTRAKKIECEGSQEREDDPTSE